MSEPMTKEEQRYVVAIFDSFAKGKNKSLTWPTLAKSMTKYEEFESKEASRRRRAIIGGPLVKDNASREDNVVSRSILTMDFDAVEGGMDDIEFLFEFDVPFDLAVHTTFSHTPETPRVRVIVPLSREVNDEEHRALVDWVASQLDPSVMGKPDPCSYVLPQLMFLPSRKVGAESWAYIEDTKGIIDVDEVLEAQGFDHDLSGAVTRSDGGSNGGGEVDDLALALLHRPLDLTEGQIGRLLEAYHAEGLEYQEWMEVGMALWHQFQGSWDGFAEWDQWSGKDEARYPGRHDLEKKWKTFDVGDRGRKPLTLATIIARAGGGDVIKVDIDTAVEVEVDGEAVALSLMDQAKGVCNLETYDAFKRRVRGLTSGELPVDRRQMLAKVVSDAWAKGAGVTITEVRKAFTPKRVVGSDGADGEGGEGRAVERVQWDCPSWLDGWVYVDGKNAGYFTQPLSDGREVLLKEGFNARYNRLVPLNEDGEMVAFNASAFALDMVQIDTAYGEMFWPGAGAMFDINGSTMVNSYRDERVEPARVGGADDDGVAARFLDLLERIIGDERERELLLDWMKWIYEEAGTGKRVKWAPLIQGGGGNGKTLIGTYMMYMIGSATPLDPVVVQERFTSWATGSVFSFIDEIRINGREKWAVMNKIKTFITNADITIEAKGKDPVRVPNFTSYLMTSNYADAIPVDEDDRRYMVIATKQRTNADVMSEFGDATARREYFAPLYDTLGREVGGGPSQVARMLLDREYSEYGFDPFDHAPWTQARKDMAAVHVDEGDEALEDALALARGPYVNDQLIDLRELSGAVGMDAELLDRMPKSSALARKLSAMGFTRGSSNIKARGVARRYWYKKAAMSEDQARVAIQRKGVKGYE